MKRVHMFLTAVTASLLLPVAAGASLSWDHSLLSFGATYAAPDGHEAVHRGVDIACEEGDAVPTPVSGEVTFVGRVPATAGGGTVLALSILGDGKVVTLLPLAEAKVEPGDSVSTGQEVATAAGAGDPSSAASHLHVGLRRGTVYLDPASVLTPATAPAPAETPVAEPVASGAQIVTNGAPTTARPALIPSPATAPNASLASVPSAAIPVRVPSGGQATAFGVSAVEVQASAPRASGQMAPGVTLATAPGVGAASLAAVDRLSARSLAREFVDALPSVAATPLGLAGIAVAGMAGTLLLSLSVIQRRFQSNPPVSDRFGSMLQHLRAGDTLCGLTSCSGLLPSQSRGRLAQRR